MTNRLEEFRKKLTPIERAEITACARRLKNWVEGGFHKVEPLGRPKKFFGHMSAEVMEVLMRSFSATTPDFTFGYNHGLYYDGLRAWRAYVRLAYAPGYYWVGVQRDDARAVTAYPGPIRQDDVQLALQKFIAGIPFKWSPASGDQMFVNPWAPKGLTFVMPRTFFGLSPSPDFAKNRIYVGSSDTPTDRCSHMHLKLIGLSALPPRMAGIGLSFARLSGSWYRANEIALKRVAEMSADHLNKQFLSGEEA